MTSWIGSSSLFRSVYCGNMYKTKSTDYEKWQIRYIGETFYMITYTLTNQIYCGRYLAWIIHKLTNQIHWSRSLAWRWEHTHWQIRFSSPSIRLKGSLPWWQIDGYSIIPWVCRLVVTIYRGPSCVLRQPPQRRLNGPISLKEIVRCGPSRPSYVWLN